MYKMPHFTEDNKEEVLRFMLANPFVVLTASLNNAPVATQIPVMIHEYDGQIILRGHIMRKTDHHNALVTNPEALILFTGPHCYVSASWYTERGHGSTWNYMTVHARGKISFLDDKQTIQLLTDLTHQYEDVQSSPELLENMSHENYVLPNVKAIAGFEMALTDIYPIFKLSQNRDDESYTRIVNELQARGDYKSKEIAEEMLKRRQNMRQL